MTAYSTLKLKLRGLFHDLPDPATTDTPAALDSSVSGRDVAERALCRGVRTVVVPDDADATTARTSLACMHFPASQYPNGVIIKGITLLSAAITPHASNHATDTFSAVGTDGVADSTVATLTTDADVAIGSGGLGGSATTANLPYAALLGTEAACTVVAGGSLCLARTKGGTGVTLGETSYTVVFEAL